MDRRWLISRSTRRPLSVKACVVLIYVLSIMPIATGKPNVVFIMADDLGYGDLGCYGNVRVETPRIDRLAANGMKFTDFHSSGPMCTPTRAATLTGLYQQRFGSKFDGAISGVRDYHSGLPLQAYTIAEHLASAGYTSGCFGKWHLGYTPAFFPTRQGFDTFYGLGSGDGDFHTRIDRSGRPDWWRDESPIEDKGYTTTLLTDKAIDFIELNRDKPFFLYLSHLAIHFPWQGPDDPPHREAGSSYHDDKWGVIPDRGNVFPHVKAMIEALDDSVGRIVDALDRNGVQEKTLVVFTSDNGGYINYAGGFEDISSNGPLRGQKAQVFEGGHRVPAIVSWPGRIAPGITRDLAHSTDWFPTFAKLANASVEGLPLDGQDLGPLLFEGKRLPDRTLFWRIREDFAVRDGAWKLVAHRGSMQLYNLEADLAETRDVSGRFPAKFDALLDLWEQWNREVNQSATTYRNSDTP